MASPTAIPASPDASADSLTERLVTLARTWAQSQQQLIFLAAELADSPEWILAGSPTPAHHLAAIADIEVSTAREWLRVGKRVRGLPTIGQRFMDGTLSYSKVRALVTMATPDNEAELAELASDTPASELRAALARWLNRTLDPDQLADHQNRQRSVGWRTEPDGMITFTARLPPRFGAIVIALLGIIVLRSRPRRGPSGEWPSLAQQHADALHEIVTNRAGPIATEVILHVRGDGCTTDDGTPICDTVMKDLVPDAFVRALIHDAEGRPIGASGRRRHPSARQRRIVKERDGNCVDCGASALLEYDHVPPYGQTKRTVVDELRLRCASCHHRRHR